MYQMKKFLKVLFAFAFCFSAMTIASGCSDDAILVTGVNFYKNEIYVSVSESVKLDYKVFPSNATNSRVTFWSTDENVASVDEAGNVTMKAEGEASIVVRTVDGGFEDSCKIISYIDPTSIAFKGDSEYPINEAPAGVGYNYYTSLAVDKTTKLNVEFLLDGLPNEEITNRNVVFTSSSESNIQVLDENSGVIKAISGVSMDGSETAYSDITATVETKNGNIKTICRVYVNKSSTIDKLFVHYANGEELLANRDGSDVLELTTASLGTEFYAYILNASGEKKTDAEFMFSTNDPEEKVVALDVDNSQSEEGIYKFTLNPVEEGSTILYIYTTCLDASGKAISLSITIDVRAAVSHASLSATERQDGGVEVLTNGELFSFSPVFKDSTGEVISGASRTLYFDELSGNIANYVRNFGSNNFRIIAVPEDMNELFTITGYVNKYPNGDSVHERVYFEYDFYIRNSLEGLIVSTSEKAVVDGVPTLPKDGITSLTLTNKSGSWGTQTIYAYALSFKLTDTEPALVSFKSNYDASKVAVQQDLANPSKFVLTAIEEGQTQLTFVVTNGVERIEYTIDIFVVNVQ